MGKIKTLDDLHARIESMDEVDNEGFVDEEETVAPQPEFQPEVEDEEGKPIEEPAQTPDVDSSKEENVTEDPTNPKDETPEVNDEFVPDMKYKAMKEEFEIDPAFAPIMKDDKVAEAVRKLHEKAAGLDHFTEKNTRLAEENKELATFRDQAINYQNEIAGYNKLIQDKQYHSLFKSINIPDDEILKVAHQIIQYKELTPDQQSAYDNNIQSHQRLHQLELENQRLQEQQANNVDNNHVAEFEGLLTSEDVSYAVKEYDTRMGRQGAFREEVINQAAMIENTSQGKTILSPKEAIDRVIRMTGLNRAPVTQPPNDVGQKQAPSNQTVVVSKKPTMPNVQAGNKAPVKQKVKTLADLQKLAEGLDDY